MPGNATEQPATILNVAEGPGRQAVSRALRDAGLHVREEATAAGALAAAAEGPGLIVLGWQLADASGLDVCRRLKAAPALAPVPVLFLAEECQDSRRRVACFEAGAEACLALPAADDELVAQARTLLRLRRAEQQLRERAEEVEKLLDVLPVAVWLSRDRDCRHVLGNPAGHAMLRAPEGVNLSKTAPEGERPTHFRVYQRGRELPPEELPLQQAARGVEVRGVEEDIVFDDGTVVHVYGSASPLFDEQGAARGAVAAFLDVTELRRADASLRESEQRLRAIGDHLPLGAVYQVGGDPGGPRRFLHISAGVERLLGVAPAEAQADAGALYGLIHEEDRGRVAAAEELALRAMAPFDCEFRSHTRTGGVRWLHCHSAPRLLLTGGLVWEGVLLDVTDRKRAEEALRRERELLATIVDRIPVMLTVYEPDTRVLRLNPAFERAVGWSAREAAGVSLMEECYPGPDDREKVREFMQSCRGGWMDVRMRTRDGRDLETSWANVRLADGTQVGIGIDITDRKRYEESLREADRRKNDFLATLAHELRNPLAPIRTGLEVLRRAEGDPGLREQARAMMERQLAQMVRLIDDLLDVSRITRGKFELRKEKIDLTGVVQAAVEGSRPLIEASGHQLTVALPPGPVLLHADPTRLAQVFGNLLTNAAKYTDRGGRIRLTAELQGGEVVVSVKDSGIGIAAEHLPRLFEMFAQVGSALERSQGGLGIGLSLVKGLVEMHGGTVRASSEGPGRGSEFVVRLPVAAPSPPSGPTPGVGSEPPGARPGRRILVADDNRDTAYSLAVVLRLAGHEVHAAHDGQEAVEAAAWFRPDVALLDIGMPKLNGLQAARHIRGQPWGRQVVLVAISGWGQEEDRRRSREAGFDEHLTKPVAPAELERVLAGLTRA
jgi:PAS domain S-box-containing protein